MHSQPHLKSPTTRVIDVPVGPKVYAMPKLPPTLNGPLAPRLTWPDILTVSEPVSENPPACSTCRFITLPPAGAAFAGTNDVSDQAIAAPIAFPATLRFLLHSEPSVELTKGTTASTPCVY